MFKGEPGTRKSTQALSFPTPQYWISSDQKMEALGLPAREWGVDTSQIDYDDYTTYQEVESKLKLFRTTCKYKTIIIDSVTSLGDCMTHETVEVKAAAGKGKKVGNIIVGGLEEWNAQSVGFQRTISFLNDIRRYHKINIILIAHVVGTREKEKTDVTQQSRIIITGGKNISGKLASYMTEVYHFDITAAPVVTQEGTYGLLTVHTGVDFARTSLNLPRRIDFNDKPLYLTYIKPAIDKLSDSK